MDAGPPGADPEEERDAAPAGHPDVVGQAAAGGGPPPPGGVLRPAVQRPRPRFPTGTRVPHRTREHPPHVERHGVVHRGRHQRLLRQPRPRGPVEHPARAHPRRPVPPADREPPEGGVPGGLEIRAHPQRHAARGRGQPDPGQHLPRPVGPIRRPHPDPGAHPRHQAEKEPGVQADRYRATPSQTAGRPCNEQPPAQTDGRVAFHRPG